MHMDMHMEYIHWRVFCKVEQICYVKQQDAERYDYYVPLAI